MTANLSPSLSLSLPPPARLPATSQAPNPAGSAVSKKGLRGRTLGGEAGEGVRGRTATRKSSPISVASHPPGVVQVDATGVLSRPRALRGPRLLGAGAEESGRAPGPCLQRRALPRASAVWLENPRQERVRRDPEHLGERPPTSCFSVPSSPAARPHSCPSFLHFGGGRRGHLSWRRESFQEVCTY